MSADFAAALLAPDAACPPGLVTWNGSDPEQRFAVYRNNVVVGLVDALADSFPVTQALVGADFFRAMAREFVRAQPPRSPVLALYGQGFAEFIECFRPAGSLPYLPDVARLEMLRVLAWHATDACPLAPAAITPLLGDAAVLADARFSFHPSLFLLPSAHAVVSLWAAHQSQSAASGLAGLDTAEAETALVCRNALEVEIFRLSPGAASFVAALLQDASFAAAAETALASDGHFDLAQTLALLLRAGAITGITTQRRKS